MNEMKRPERWSEAEEEDDFFRSEPDFFVLLPDLEAPGHWVAVFADGSWVRDWAPS